MAVNASTNRIYVANNDSNNVSVIDGASNTVVATVAVGHCPTGVAVNPNTNRIYVANHDDNNVSVIDGASNTVVATVVVGSMPFGVAVNPARTASTWRTWQQHVSVIDGASNTVVATVAVGSGPGGVAVNPSTNRIYVTDSGSGSVSVIDGATNTVVASVAVGPMALRRGRQPQHEPHLRGERLLQQHRLRHRRRQQRRCRHRSGWELPPAWPSTPARTASTSPTAGMTQFRLLRTLPRPRQPALPHPRHVQLHPYPSICPARPRGHATGHRRCC